MTTPNPSTSPWVLRATALSHTYGRGRDANRILTSVDLTIRAGEIVGVHGPSGCGKSTLLRLLARLETPTHGSIEFAERETTGPRPTEAHPPADDTATLPRRALHRRPNVMAIFQDPTGSLDPRWPIWRSVTEPMLATPWHTTPRRSHRRQRASELVAAVGLDPNTLDALPSELSRGQCQRAAILRAIVADPLVILADEPTSALDVSVGAGVLHLLAQRAQRGTAIIVVSHDLDMLAVLCHRRYLLDSGRLQPTKD